MSEATQQEMEYPMAERVQTVVPPFNRPLFIVAYWPPGKWWKVHGGLFAENETKELDNEVERLKFKGWAHIQIMRLPEQEP